MGSLNKRSLMPIGIGKREQLGGKEDSRFLGLSGWIADIHSKFCYPPIDRER